MDEIKRLGDAELEIMLIIWHADKPITSSYAMEQLQGRRKWALSTVMTSLARLCDKGFLSCDRTSGTNLYQPLITEEDYKSAESKSFLEKLFGNSFQNFVTSLYSSKVIEDTDLAELHKFIEELEKGD